MQSLSLHATPLDIITHCFLCYHHLFAQSVFRQIPSMGGYVLHKQLFVHFPRERILLPFVVSPLTAAFLLRSRAGAAAPPESLKDKV